MKNDNWVILRGVVWAFMASSSWALFLALFYMRIQSDSIPNNYVYISFIISMLIFAFGIPRKEVENE